MFIHNACDTELKQQGQTWLCPHCCLIRFAAIDQIDGLTTYVKLIYTLPILQSIAQAV